ncbi:hypothetical protein PSTG_18570, partial [Puccinia striiformis f. sp. tritici PST-78]
PMRVLLSLMVLSLVARLQLALPTTTRILPMRSSLVLMLRLSDKAIVRVLGSRRMSLVLLTPTRILVLVLIPSIESMLVLRIQLSLQTKTRPLAAHMPV